jgi:three-Cys-motif partner protein
MKNKWDCRVYIDLYSGPGLLRIRGTDRFIWGSPIHALSVADPFDKYIFCDHNPEAIEALRSRVK